MIIGIPKEIKQQENRVSLLPSAAYQLTKRGHTVLVEKNAGVGTGYPDADYDRGRREDHRQCTRSFFEQAEMIVKVKEPLPAEYELLRKGQILFTYLHLAASRALTEALLKSGVTGVAYETIEVSRRLPLLEPMSEIAGRMSVVMGGLFSCETQRRQRRPARRRAGRVAGQRRGAGRRNFGGQCRPHGHGPRRRRDHSRSGPRADAVSRHHDAHGAHALFERSTFAGIDAVGRSAHRRGARPGSQGAEAHYPRNAAPDAAGQRARRYRDRPGRLRGNVSPDDPPRPGLSSRKASFITASPTCPAAYARTATQALTNITYRYVELLADLGLKEACERQPALTGGINTMDGTAHSSGRRRSPRDGI